MKLGVVVAALLFATSAWAQDATPSGLLGPPQPAISSPPSEIVAGQVGVSDLYARGDHTHPRITRAMVATTIGGGTFSGTWGTALAATPTLILTPIATGGAAVTCELTSAPTTTTFAGRCWTSQTSLLNLSIVTAGLTIAPNTASSSGISVEVIAIPPTQ